MNATGRPEAVLTGNQWSKIDRLLARESSIPSVLEVRDVDGELVGRMRVEAARVAVEVSRSG